MEGLIMTRDNTRIPVQACINARLKYFKEGRQTLRLGQFLCSELLPKGQDPLDTMNVWYEEDPNKAFEAFVEIFCGADEPQ